MKNVTPAIIMVLLLPISVMATPSPKLDLPTPLGYVSDYANILTPQWQSQIRSVCKDLETRTGVEMIVVTLPTVEPLTNAHDYASKLYEGWRIGTAQQERGILLVTSMKERQAVVVLGRTLLSVISPQKLDQISEQHLVPMFSLDNLWRTSLSERSPIGNGGGRGPFT